MNSLTTTKDWITTCDRYVAYIDIMGFKDMVARSDHDDIYQMMKKIDSSRKLVGRINWGDKPLLTKSTTYSDSIMIYSNDDSFESLYSIICSVSGLMDGLLREGIPFKGAISFGKMTLDDVNSIFFGQPLIDAYLLQNEIHFYGVILDANTEKNFFNYSKHIPFTVNYPVYLKSGRTNHLSVHPIHTVFYGEEKHRKAHEDLFLAINKLRFMTSGSLRKYIDNTQEFLSDIRDSDGKYLPKTT